MGFLMPSAPSTPPTPTPTPTIDDEAVKQAAADQAALLQKRRGRASTILTSPSGVGSASGGATLLG